MIVQVAGDPRELFSVFSLHLLAPLASMHTAEIAQLDAGTLVCLDYNPQWVYHVLIV